MSARVALALVLALAACSDKDPSDGVTAPLSTSDVDPMSSGDTPTSTDANTSGETSGATSGETGGTGDGTTGASTGSETTGGAGDPCAGDAPRVLLATTLGDLVIELDAVGTPVTTANFLAYVQEGFYDGTIFHRVIDGFVIQGGGFTPELQEKPPNPAIDLEIGPLKHIDGAISMARTDDPNSATSQFFVCDGPQDFLDGQYAVFGVLVEGFDVLAAISAVPTGLENGFEGVPIEDVIVMSASCVP